MVWGESVSSVSFVRRAGLFLEEEEIVLDAKLRERLVTLDFAWPAIVWVAWAEGTLAAAG